MLSDSRNQNLRPNTQIEANNSLTANGRLPQSNKDQTSPQSNNNQVDSKNETRHQSRHGTNLFSFGNITPEFYEQQAIMLEKKSPGAKLL